MYDALNRALGRSVGDIIGHLNADEQYLPGILERVAALFDANPGADVICGDMVLFDSRFRARAYRRSVLPPPRTAALVPLQIPTCGLFIRRRIFRSGIQYRDDLRVIADAVLIEDLISRGTQFLFDPVPYAAFFIHGGNLSGAPAAQDDRQMLLKNQPQDRFAVVRAKVSVWLRKALAGAYFPRRVDASIFTRSSSDRRQTRQSRFVTWIWPKHS